jgi:hypothetical protein
MKSLLMLAMVGAFSLVSVLDAEACHRRRCGGHHRRGCGNGCYVQQPCYSGGYSNGCQVYGGYNGQMQGGYGGQMGNGYVDPAAGNVAPAVDQNAPPADPEPVR